MDDYHAFTSIAGSGGAGDFRCSSGWLSRILAGLAILYLIGKLV